MFVFIVALNLYNIYESYYNFILADNRRSIRGHFLVVSAGGTHTRRYRPGNEFKNNNDIDVIVSPTVSFLSFLFFYPK